MIFESDSGTTRSLDPAAVAAVVVAVMPVGAMGVEW